MSETSVSFDLLQTLQIFTQFVLQSVGQDLRVLSVLHVFGSVQEVVGDLVLAWVLNDVQKKVTKKRNQLFLHGSYNYIYISYVTSNLLRVNILTENSAKIQEEIRKFGLDFKAILH